MGAIKFDCDTQDFERNAKKVMQEIKTDQIGIIKQMGVAFIKRCYQVYTAKHTAKQRLPNSIIQGQFAICLKWQNRITEITRNRTKQH